MNFLVICSLLVVILALHYCDASGSKQSTNSVNTVSRAVSSASGKVNTPKHLFARLMGVRGGAGSAKVQEISTLADLNKLLKSATKKKQLVVIDFTASWCGPCQMIAPLYKQISERPEFTDVIFVKVDVDEGAEVAEQYGVQAMPTFLLIKQGKTVETLRGANAQKLVDLILDHQ